MSNVRRSRRETRYFVLRTAGHEPEIARISSRGSSSYFDPDTQSWINDPLLGSEIKLTEDWTPAAANDLPDAVRTSDAVDPSPPPSPSRSLGRRLRRFS